MVTKKNFEPGKFVDTHEGFETPVDWITDGLTKFCFMISRHYPDSFLPIDLKAERIYSYECGIRALKQCIKHVKKTDEYDQIEFAESLTTWYKDAILTFIIYNYRYVPKQWRKGSDKATEKFMKSVRIDALTRVRKSLSDELTQVKANA